MPAGVFRCTAVSLRRSRVLLCLCQGVGCLQLLLGLPDAVGNRLAGTVYNGKQYSQQQYGVKIALRTVSLLPVMVPSGNHEILFSIVTALAALRGGLFWYQKRLIPVGKKNQHLTGLESCFPELLL